MFVYECLCPSAPHTSVCVARSVAGATACQSAARHCGTCVPQNRKGAQSSYSKLSAVFLHSCSVLCLRAKRGIYLNTIEGIPLCRHTDMENDRPLTRAGRSAISRSRSFHSLATVDPTGSTEPTNRGPAKQVWDHCARKHATCEGCQRLLGVGR